MRLLPPAVDLRASVLSEGLPVFPICTSATGQTQTSGHIPVRSVLLSTTDMRRLWTHFRFVPIADSCTAAS